MDLFSVLVPLHIHRLITHEGGVGRICRHSSLSLYISLSLPFSLYLPLFLCFSLPLSLSLHPPCHSVSVRLHSPDANHSLSLSFPSLSLSFPSLSLSFPILSLSLSTRPSLSLPSF